MLLRLLLCLMCCDIGLIISMRPTTDVFDFGVCNDNSYGEKQGGKVTFNVAGNIRNHEKVLNIPLTIAYCMELSYVRVEVDNPVNPPYVSLDRDYLVVTIKYRPNQPSKSTYLVIGKTIVAANCTS